MTESLFRPDAIAETGVRHLEGKGLLTGGNLLPATAGLTCIITITIWLILSANYTRKHLVTGYLDETGTTILHAKEFGHLRELLVSEGDLVQQGQYLGRIEYTQDGRTATRVKELQQQLEHWYEARTQAETGAQQKLRQLDEEESQLDRLMAISQQDMALQEEKVKSMDLQVELSRGLHEKGYLSSLDWLRFKTNLTTERQQLFRQQEKLLELQRQRSSLEHQRHNLKADLAARLIDYDLNLSKVREALSGVQREPYQKLIATQPGIVTRLEASEGGSFRPGDPVLYLSNLAQASSATLLVPPSAAGHLRSGDSLALELDAFPFETWGHVQAKVERMPNHTLITASGQPMYPVRLSITPSELIDLYLPGMTLTGHITVERKSIANWLFSPIKRMLEVFS